MYTDPVSDVMIRVPAEVRDQLAAVAEARGMSLRALMQDIAASTLTPEQIKERADRTRALLAEGLHVGGTATFAEAGGDCREARHQRRTRLRAVLRRSGHR